MPFVAVVSVSSFTFASRRTAVGTSKENQMERMPDLIEGFIQIVGGIALLTTMLPNSSKYGFVTRILKFLNFLGANFGKSKNRDD